MANPSKVKKSTDSFQSSGLWIIWTITPSRQNLASNAYSKEQSNLVIRFTIFQGKIFFACDLTNKHDELCQKHALFFNDEQLLIAQKTAAAINVVHEMIEKKFDMASEFIRTIRFKREIE